MKTNLDLVKECDVFPYKETDPKGHAALLSTLYTLIWEENNTTTPIGHLPESVFNALAKVPISLKGELEVNRSTRTITAFPFPTSQARSSAVARTTAHWRASQTFALLAGWRNELYPVYGPGNALLFNIERAASALFGVVTYGVHLTAYLRTASGLQIWVPRRSRTKQTYPGLLDNTVAGGIASGESAWESVVRECEEEAGFAERLVREGAQARGSVTYMYLSDERRGGETGMVMPECQWVYDLELPSDGSVVPVPSDGEVEEFYLWGVEEIKEHLAKGEFKPNCAMVMLDFFVRHGVLTEENEPDFAEIKRRLHRDLEFPGPHKE